ncbi:MULTISPECIES: hypothetical protein [Geobacter]|uniref:hypothetical protein n=1 Tax=Geobacter TaxID=28231 RepID=UPI0025734425|nr:hypothetical protein [Geobacter sulfurreducens]BEH10510.1 hypothetical protein GSUET_21220 [Geobacter sulfurreducens subsp. ethanolicus]BET57881.1 hypothetical protein GEO60473_09210 [Geobacter sp. 60473]
MEYADLKTKKISFLPLGDGTIASSRLRCYKLQDGLERLGFISNIGFDEFTDVLFIQKRTDDAAIDAAYQCKQKSGVLIFDIDDFPDSPTFKQNSELLISLADVVTTATHEQKKIVGHTFTGVPTEKIFYLPNPIDYELEQPKSKFHEQRIPLKIVWFGNIENYPMSLAKELCCINDVEFHAITNATAGIRKNYPDCHFHDWSYENFSDMLSEFDVCLLSHYGSEIFNAKSANKMITAIVHGLPVIASRTPDYLRLSRLAEIDQWLFDDEGTLRTCIDRSRDPSLRNAFIASTQQVVWAHFHIEKILQNFLDIVREAITFASCNDPSNVRPTTPKGLLGLIVNRLRVIVGR